MIRRHREEKKKKLPFFEGMNLLEILIVVLCPLVCTFVIFTVSDSIISSLLIRFGVSVGIVSVLFTLIYFIADWLSKRDI